MNGVAWLLEEQQELLVLPPLGWEESRDVRNCLVELRLCSAAQEDFAGLWEAHERDNVSVCGAVNGVAWLLEEQQELLVLPPLGWEEFQDIHNC